MGTATSAKWLRQAILGIGAKVHGGVRLPWFMRPPQISLFLLLLMPLAGCLGEFESCTDTPELQLLRPSFPGHELSDSTVPWQSVMLSLEEPASVSVASSWALQPSTLVVETPRISPDGEYPRFSMMNLSNFDVAPRAELDWRHEGCETREGKFTWELTTPRTGVRAGAGQGVHVYTAGFWANGTMFYTNIEAMNDSPWPRAGWYDWEGGDALPVYVYDESSAERSLIWGANTNQFDPSAPPAGTPWNYFVTIAGFNEGLKGVSTQTTRVVHMAAEDAYTRAGNEDHPLYGDDLVFLIFVDAVVDVPCPPEFSSTCEMR